MYQEQTVFDVLIFSLAVILRGHKQRKSNHHVYSFLSFVYFRSHYQAEFEYNESGLLHCKCRVILLFSSTLTVLLVDNEMKCEIKVQTDFIIIGYM